MSNRIRELRNKQVWTLKALGEKVGLAPNTISQYETGDREPKLKTWQKLADCFGVPIPYLQGLGVSRDAVIGDLIDELINDREGTIASSLRFLLNKNVEKVDVSTWMMSADLSDNYSENDNYVGKAIEIKDKNTLYFFIDSIVNFVNDYNFLLGLNRSDEKNYYDMLQKKIDLELSNKLDSWQWIEFKTETLKLPESDKCTLMDIFAGLFDEIDELKSRVYDLENPDGPFDRDDFM
ncbi:helix-turn-helix transcriptional regulator [Ligilactobacillus murinus]|nr:helix-turn-helix transcriptional regulator [Ligilactobacillus murinus]